MSVITIQDVINLNSTRDAQRIIKGAIEEYVRSHDMREDEIALLLLARNSVLVNGPYPCSRKLSSVTLNQILDRMNTQALAFAATNIIQKNQGLQNLKDQFEHCPPTLNPSTMPGLIHWPYWMTLSESDIDYDTHLGPWIDVQATPPTPTAPTPPAASKTAFNTDMLNIANMAMDKATYGAVKDIATVLEELEELRARPTTVMAQALPVQASGDIPDGKPVRKNAKAVFGLKDKLLDFEITVYEWAGTNPLVPSIMQHFKFDVEALADLLWARETKKNAWLVGHTGTGKSTLVEQVCAHTMTMFQRVNFDSDITRLEFVGKVDVVTNDDGNQVTSFTDGILPTAMQMPCVLMLDEADAIRGDIAYVLQPVLEGKSLRLLEDGGRMVQPHPEFTIVATANTAGSGDSTGMYSAAVKMQSAAAMNRYNLFINVDYMAVDDEMNVIKAMVPTLSKGVEQKLGSFITHYRNAIKIGEVSKPISPRNTITIAQYATDFEGRLGADAAFERALQRNLFNAMDEGERAIAVGIADRNA